MDQVFIQKSKLLGLRMRSHSVEMYNSIVCLLIHNIVLSSSPQTGSLAGNLCIKKMHPEFPSDVFILLETVGARIIVAEGVDKMTEVSIAEFMMKEIDMNKKVLACICLPTIKSAMNQVLTYKVIK